MCGGVECGLRRCSRRTVYIYIYIYIIDEMGRREDMDNTKSEYDYESEREVAGHDEVLYE